MGLNLDFDDVSIKNTKVINKTETIIEDKLIGMDIQIYHSKKEYLSSSQLKDLLDNPYLFFHPKDRKETKAYILGSAIHCLVLEPEIFNDEFAVAPEVNKRTKAGRDEWDKFVEDNKGKTVLSKEDYDNCKACADSTLAIPQVQALLMDGVSEKSFFTSKGGQKKKVRPDRYREKENVIIDVKTCPDSSANAFKKDVANWKYFVQASYYIDVLGASKFIFLAVEKEYPYMVGIYELCEADLDRGRELIAKAIETSKKEDEYQTPLRKGSRGEIVQTLVLPNYIHYDYEN